MKYNEILVLKKRKIKGFLENKKGKFGLKLKNSPKIKKIKILKS